MVDLNTLIPPSSALHLAVAYDINDRGEIAGFGTLASGEVHAFLLVPNDRNAQRRIAATARIRHRLEGYLRPRPPSFAHLWYITFTITASRFAAFSECRRNRQARHQDRTYGRGLPRRSRHLSVLRHPDVGSSAAVALKMNGQDIMRIPNQASYALSVCAAVAVLAGCNSGAGVFPSLGNGFAQNSNHPSSTDLRFVGVRDRVGNESLTTPNIKWDGACPRYGGNGTFSTSGNATGRYSGIFTASGKFYLSNCTSGGTQVSETFNITAGAKVISGSFDGNAPFKRFHGGQECFLEPSSDFNYKAQVMRGVKVLKYISGSGI